MNDTYPFVNTPLPYAYNALEPYIDAETMRLHHDAHLGKYISDLNEVLAAVEQGHGDRCELQKKSVFIDKYKTERYELRKIRDNIYQWTTGYDTFLGYMSGVLEYE